MAALSGWDAVKEYEAQYPGTVRRCKEKAEPLQVAQEPVIPTNDVKIKAKSDKKAIDKEENSTYSVLNKPQPALTNVERDVLALITREGCLTDEVIARADLPAGTVKSVLTKLTLKKLIVSHPGGRVSLK